LAAVKGTERLRKLLRLLQILSVIGRYRLDESLPAHYRRPLLRLLLLPFKIVPARKLNRGESLRRACEDLGPIFIKFGQLLSTRPDLIPPELTQELNQLQDNVAPFPNAEFKRIVEKALGGSVEELFLEFDEAPLASASIAQVHTAVLLTGEAVVVKAVRPGIEHTITKDIQLMQFVAQTLERFSPESKRLRPVEVVNEYKDTIFDELNLMREAANASQLRRNWLNSPLLYVPKVYWDYCRRNVMVMERVDGIQATDVLALKAQNTDLKLLAERGVEIFFTQVFEHNFFHADMHPGNVFISREHPHRPSYIALDMAIIGSLTREDQYYLARNLLAMFRRDYRQVAELHVLSGWVPKHTSIAGFEGAIRAVCEPIFEKPLKDISFGEALITLFQTARRFDMPVQPQLVLLQKTLLNIEGMGRQLYPELDLWATAHPYLERWMKDRFHPKRLYQDFKRQGPEWMEQLPDVPHLVLDTVNRMKELGETAPELRRVSEVLADERTQASRRRRRSNIALAAFVGALFTALPQLTNLPVSSLILLGVGLLALLLQ
jgi:ubiquinone biosynthesis protein